MKKAIETSVRNDCHAMKKTLETIVRWDLRQFFYRHNVNDIFVLFNLGWSSIQEFFNSCHIIISFSMEAENRNKLSFLNVEVILGRGKFTTTIYRKPTFNGIYCNFENLLPSVCICVWYVLYFIDVSLFAQIRHNSIEN